MGGSCAGLPSKRQDKVNVLWVSHLKEKMIGVWLKYFLTNGRHLWKAHVEVDEC